MIVGIRAEGDRIDGDVPCPVLVDAHREDPSQRREEWLEAPVAHLTECHHAEPGYGAGDQTDRDGSTPIPGALDPEVIGVLRPAGAQPLALYPIAQRDQDILDSKVRSAYPLERLGTGAFPRSEGVQPLPTPYMSRA